MTLVVLMGIPEAIIIFHSLFSFTDGFLCSKKEEDEQSFLEQRRFFDCNGHLHFAP